MAVKFLNGLKLSGGSLDANSWPVVNLPTPTASGDAATKGYVDLGGIAVGMAIPSSRFTLPGSNWSWCDGQSLLRATYPDCFAVLTAQQTGTFTSGSAVVTGLASTRFVRVGCRVEASRLSSVMTVVAVTSTTVTLSGNAASSGTGTLVAIPYGAADTTHFNLPNIAGRTIVGDGTGASLTARVAGESLGAETHQLSAAESGTPSHSHGITDPGHSHYSRLSTDDTLGSDGYALRIAAATSHSDALGYNLPTATGISVNNATASVAAAAHNNLQPSLVLPWVIRLT